MNTAEDSRFECVGINESQFTTADNHAIRVKVQQVLLFYFGIRRAAF